MASSLAWAQQQADYRADVDRVLLHVAVIDPRGGEVPTLDQEDFKVFDDGVEQQIGLFMRPDDAPIDVAMVLDSSTSMRPVETSARRAAIAFLGRMALDDCIYVLPFADRPASGRWGRAGDPEMRQYIDSIRAGGGTALHDAVLEGLAQLERANANELVARATEAEEALTTEPDAEDEEESAPPARPVDTVQQGGGSTPVLPPRRTSLLHQVQGAIRDLDLDDPPPVRGCGELLPRGELPNAANARRKALLLLSDGADMDSKASFYDALGAARAASVPVFPVVMGFAGEDPRLRDHLAEIARATGGRLIENAAPGELGDSYDQVVALLRSFYLIGYEPDAGGGVAPTTTGGRARWHDVRVELRRPNFEPLVRPGYYR